MGISSVLGTILQKNKIIPYKQKNQKQNQKKYPEIQHILENTYDRNTTFKKCIFNIISENKSDFCLLVLVLEQLISAAINNNLDYL